MHIIRLEMTGFKSFADKTVIHFDRGITGIVGPNGCGKSNVVDALFWVMGEQSAKHLRGASMEDVIFGGSQKREKSDIAQVTMVVSKEGVVLAPEYDKLNEIQLTRKLYRSGESEYLINNIPARMRDIQELFMGTGVGTKAYSIIEQGAIGKMVNAKPEDRRQIVEEAAGITKYKRRRMDSVRKLEGTKQNLLRVTDIIAEKEKFLGSLERQAKKAEKYRVLRDRTKILDLALSSRGGKKLEEVLLDLDRLINEKQTAEATHVVEYEKLSLGLEERRQQMQDLEQKAQQSQNELLNLTSREGRNEKELALIEQNLESLQKEKLRLEREFDHFEERAREIEEEKATLESSAQELKELFDAADQKAQSKIAAVEDLRRQINAKEAEEKEEIQNKFQRVERFSRNSSTLEQNQLTLESLAHREQEIQSHLESIEHQLELLKNEEVEAQSRLESVTDAIREKTRALQATQDLIDKTHENLNEKRAQVKQLDRDYTRIKTEFESLKSLSESYEGFDQGVRYVMSLPESEERPVLLSNVLDVPENLQPAVETLLGNRLQSMVVPSVTAARALGMKLKEANVGRGNFIPTQCRLSTHGAELEGVSIDQLQGITGRLSDMIQAREGYESIAHLLFDRVLVAQDLPSAVQIWENHRDLPFMIITEDGDALEPTGTLTSGRAILESSGLLKRREHLDALRAKLEETGSKLALAEPAVSNLENDLAIQTAEKEKSFDELHELKLNASHATKDLENIHERSRMVQKDLNNRQGEFTRLNDQRETLKSQMALLDKENKDIIEKQRGESNRLVEIENELKQLKIQLSENDAVAQEERVQLAQSQEQWKHAQSRLDEKIEEASDLDSKREWTQEQLDRTNEQVAEGHQRKAELQSALQDSSQKRNDMKDLAEKLRADSSGFFEAVRAEERKVEELRRIVDDLRQSLLEVRLKREQEGNTYQRMVDHVFERYGVVLKEVDAISAWEDLKNLYPELVEQSEEQLLVELDELRKKLFSMGEVNVMAIDEFDTVKKEHAFLTEQKADLEKAMEQLQQTIEEMDQNSERMFTEMFHAINEKFKVFFPMLFGGGSAELLLTQSDNPLETGVDIVAQPPGKKLQNVSLLSGGEKALTAVSLIFSIFDVKPAPFCLLDEVDAPLDDANVGRFNNMIRKMSESSQFIVITHNKRTMEMVDVLYGVTMQEAGISNMSSIRLV